MYIFLVLFMKNILGRILVEWQTYRNNLSDQNIHIGSKRLIMNQQQIQNKDRTRTQQPKQIPFEDDSLSLQDQDILSEQIKDLVLPLQKQKQEFPTFSQIQRCMTVVSNLMPQMFSPVVVSHFYTKLMSKFPSTSDNQIERLSKSRQNKVKIEEDFFPDTKRNESQGYQMSNHYQNRGLKISGIKASPADLTDTEWKQRHKLRKIISDCFCRGKTFEGTREEVSRQLPQTVFNSTIYTKLLQQLLLETQRYVQNLVIQGYCIKGGKIVYAQDKSIQRIMANCKYKLSSQVCQIIFKAVQEYASQGLVIMSKEEGMLMLKGINEALTNKTRDDKQQKQLKVTNQMRASMIQDASGLGTKRYKFELHRMWNNEFQKMMLEMYKNGSRFVQIKQKLCEYYPLQKDMFTIRAIRSMFFKILRIAIRRLLKQYKERKTKFLTQMTPLTDQLVKNIINYTECREIRKLLIELYQSQNYPKNKLQTLIMKINQYSRSGGHLQKSQALSMSSNDQQ